ncbi:MAG: chorismate synthase, partial [Lachnospiraceae bacterium]|nr:chorismate synthase [Lachnospiraceae bacterium]
VKDGKIVTKTNHCGGILGGMSTGGDIIIKAYIKPTPSISLPQQTVTDAGEPVTLEIKGRHDISIVKRVAPVLEAMCALVLADELLVNMSAKMSNVISFYKE